MRADKDRWIMKERSGGKTLQKMKAQQPIDPNVVYVVRIAFDGTTYTVTVDGVTILTMTPLGPVSGGTVGFQVKGTTGTFDYIEVN